MATLFETLIGTAADLFPFFLREHKPAPEFRNIVLDVETLSLEPNSALMSIGAVNFDLHTGEVRSQFYINVDWELDIRRGGAVDDDTRAWWQLPQNAKSWAESNSDPVDPAEAVVKFQAWLLECCPSLYSSPRDYNIWAMGSEFDPPILNSFYRRWMPTTGKPPRDLLPRHSLADMRFLMKLFRGRVAKPAEVTHNALQDACDQYTTIMKYRRLGIFRGMFNPLRNLP